MGRLCNPFPPFLLRAGVERGEREAWVRFNHRSSSGRATGRPRGHLTRVQPKRSVAHAQVMGWEQVLAYPPKGSHSCLGAGFNVGRG